MHWDTGGSPQTLLIALTGYGQAEDLRRLREVGIDCHYTKPIDLASLRIFINHSLVTRKAGAV